jgi:diaminobutyrate-2-oxoglutarate transaminase
LRSIAHHESEVRSYVRSWPTVFERAAGHLLIDEDGNEYIDFFAGAGVMNYGHNPVELRGALTDYLAGDSIVHSLDMATVARRTFLETFHEVILEPRGMDHVVMFPGPTGTNAVEAALKLARKVTGRTQVVGFTNAFHGMTLGSLAVSGNSMKREGAGVMLNAATHLPFDGYFGADVDTVAQFRQLLDDGSSGLETPAAVIVETVQAEGGINVASARWLRDLQQVCRDHDILFIVDDIQVGVGRTGRFFSFEEAGLDPDIITLSKSLSGYGLPFAVTLIRRELDIWAPGEHNGTFRGFNPAMVTATAALETFWRDEVLTTEVLRKGEVIAAVLDDLAETYPALGAQRRGRGLIQGLACAPGIAGEAVRHAFENGLVIETSGPDGEVVKLLPSLTIDDTALLDGLEILADALVAAISAERRDTVLDRLREVDATDTTPAVA